MTASPTGPDRAIARRQAVDALDALPLVDLTRELIRIDSTNPPGNDRGIAEHMAARAEDWGLEATLQAAPGGQANVLVRLPGVGQAPTLLLCGHIDTIPTGADVWERAPFRADLAGGRIHGRGASDMKSGLAVMLVALAALKRSGTRLPGDVLLAGMTGEVTDFVGSRHFLATGGMTGVGWLVVGEPTNLDFVVAHRGVLWAEATTYGRSGHGSSVNLGPNAIVSMAELIRRLAD